MCLNVCLCVCVAVPPGSVVTFPPQGLWFLCTAYDALANLSTSANITIRVIPNGVPQFLGLAPPPPQGYSTAGGGNVTVTGKAFVGASVNATYSNPDLGLFYSTKVGAPVPACGCCGVLGRGERS